MSAIFGIITKQEIVQPELLDYCRLMQHRGSGNVRVWCCRDHALNIGFAADVPEYDHVCADQPYVDGNRMLVFDGGIYNADELCGVLAIPRETKPNEIIMRAYEKWGKECVAHFNGDFAIAIYDSNSHELYCARDPFAVKPLYYAFTRKGFVFASELKSIMAFAGDELEIDRSCLVQYLSRGYIHFPQTIFKNVNKLEAGRYFTFSDEQLKKTQYYDLVQEYYLGQEHCLNDYEEVKSELERLLSSAIEIRCAKDCPTGAFLSGGIDSTMMATLLQRQNCLPVNTFSIGFEDAAFNEAEDAKATANLLGTEHRELYITASDMLKLIDEVPVYYDEPYGDSSQIPSMLVAALAKKKGINVIITGDGGDELFCGYNTYEYIEAARKLDYLGGMVHALTKPIGLENRLPYKIKMISKNRDSSTKIQFMYEFSEQILCLCCGKGGSAKFPVEDRFPLNNWMMRAMLLDQQTYVPGTIIKVERSAMRSGISARSPFCDLRINRLAYRMPFEYKYHEGVKKRILKDILFQYVPKEMMDRPKKGFSIPQAAWLRTYLRDRLEDYSGSDFLRRQGWFDVDMLQKDMEAFLSGSAGVLGGAGFYWRYLMLQMWYARYRG